MNIASFDIDGVIFNGHGVPGIYPGPNDIIITGRSFEEEKETYEMLVARGIMNAVYFNPLPFEEKTRATSGLHKASVINKLLAAGINITHHFEDDTVQAYAIRKLTPVYVVIIENPAVPKENRRQDDLIAKA